MSDLNLGKWSSCEDEFWPKATGDNPVLARKAFLKLWAAGTVGGLFAALMRSAATDIQHLALQPDWRYTLDVFLRYGYLAWFVFYFFLSNLRFEYEPPTVRSTVFDVTQSFGAFVAAVCLGFLLSGRDSNSFTRSSLAFAAANAAIVLLAGFAMSFGGGRAMTILRRAGLAAATVALIASVCQPFGPLRIINGTFVTLMLAVLWLVLLSFRAIRICELKPSSGTQSCARIESTAV